MSAHFNTPLIDRVTTAHGVSSFDLFWEMVRKPLKSYARKLSKDRERRKDMLQFARERLWILEPTRYDPRRPEVVAWVQRVLARKMYDRFGKEREIAQKELNQIYKRLGVQLPTR